MLEVVVALVILSTSGLALFSWISQNLATATRLQQSQARSQLQLEGVSWLSTINPAVEPDGERELSGMRLAWRATLIEPMRPEFDYGGGLLPRWILGLYRVEASVTRIDTGLRADWVQVVTGWKLATYSSGGSPNVSNSIGSPSAGAQR
ncbi:general secretion pathway protein I [Roseateles asaccharophilus]|uniref:General secretion pathway protein I n=1 Tax=Roseateles asaccharophilus TaxID=582607 RepID=A0ABU2ABZ2_9BURK|nr:general secretion pathway protein I [Roseateles asaccharophilus]